MDVLKAALFVVMALCLGLMWHERDFVLDAYRQDDDGPAELRLSGVTLDFEKTDIPASPYVVHTAPDTRRRPMSLLFTAPEVDPVEMVGGESRISGIVRIDGEPASGAVVRLERHTSAGTGVRDVIVGADGRFTVRNLTGGRYRVRAWIPGSATMTSSDVFFLEAEEEIFRDYGLQLVDQEPRVEFVNGGTMTVGLSGGFGVVISRNDVDADGIVVTAPVSGVEVSATFTDDVSLLSPLVTSTNERGVAEFRMRCLKPTTGRATVTVGEEVWTVALAACVPKPPTTEASIDVDGAPGSDGGGPTTTQPAGGSAPTTSTTRPAGTGGTASNGGGNG
ncbi:MAG: carboxypeptidase-like regulatory domain-containing protein [Acidimicrobiia bacterium]|nr:carboxypeptidase-like regulatory domain-containing protein [Acidimicrobiia bacterium]